MQTDYLLCEQFQQEQKVFKTPEIRLIWSNVQIVLQVSLISHF